MATVISDQRVLSDDLLQSFGERASTYDRENRFFSERTDGGYRFYGHKIFGSW